MLVHTHGHLLTCPGDGPEVAEDSGGVGGVTRTRPNRVPVESLLPAQLRDLSLRMRSPTKPGIYESRWMLSTAAGLFFGDEIW